jgi:uncharacterized protein (TIGR03083 family)
VVGIDYLEVIRRESRALAEAADGNLRLPVPACPGWSVADLVWHIGEAQDFWGSVAEGPLQDVSGMKRVDRPSDAELITWFPRQTERLVSILETADPSARIWNWAEQKELAFIPRRMAHEAAVHRWDSQSATGSQLQMEPSLAVDGIDEFLDVYLPVDGDFGSGSEIVHLHSTDASGEWVIRVEKGAMEVSREHAKGDVAARGPASDLLLLLWRRLGRAVVDVRGDAGALDRFLARADLT